MEFFDCNLNYGPKVSAEDLVCCADIGGLIAEMTRAGIAGGLVLKTIKEAVLANTELANDIKSKDNLKGVWFLLPSCTGEIPSPQDLPEAMKRNNIAALAINPTIHRYLPNKAALGDYLEMASVKKIPVLLNTSRGLTIGQADDIMRDFPALTAILTFDNCWPSDRFLRPFLDAYPNLCLDMTYILTDCWLKDIVKRYAADRILFGSGYPVSYMGAHMPVIRHAEIAEEDKIKIAGGNLKRLIREAGL